MHLENNLAFAAIPELSRSSSAVQGLSGREKRYDGVSSHRHGRQQTAIRAMKAELIRLPDV